MPAVPDRALPRALRLRHPPEEYRRHVNDAILFLEGKRTELVDELGRRMREAAAEMRFEEAARLRDQLDAITQTLAPQKIVSTEPVDRDAVGLARTDRRLAIYLLRVRAGRVVGGRAFNFRGQAFPEAEALASFLNMYYTRADLIPAQVLLPVEIEGKEALRELLSGRKGARMELRVPARGATRELVRMSCDNARSTIAQRRAMERAVADDGIAADRRVARAVHVTGG